MLVFGLHDCFDVTCSAAFARNSNVTQHIIMLLPRTSQHRPHVLIAGRDASLAVAIQQYGYADVHFRSWVLSTLSAAVENLDAFN